ncbi:MAG: RusA family crossover junction endodeoxyribonuclease [Deltaproteobacteria bacterium]|nr:RusA family crossover junction endodeoxyribonuclease [Deltaproteobacteria bacterium]
MNEGQDAGRLIFTIYGDPVPQQRAGRRHFIAGGKPMSQAFDPEKSRTWKQDVKDQVLRQLEQQGLRGQPLHDGPVEMFLWFYLRRPESIPKKVKRCFKKPDLDNLEKAVKDALKGIVYTDDGRVDDVRKGKLYGDPPRVVIALRLLPRDAEEAAGA